MLHMKENKKKVLEVFFKFPLRNFYLREISRLTKISITAVKNYVKEFLKEKLIIEELGGIYPSFRSNRESDGGEFVFYKKMNNLENLRVSGLIDFIEENCAPLSIVFFGSSSKGEDIENSDLDLFVQSKEKKLDLSKFEKKFSREINLFFEKDFNQINKNLRNNILNGIVVGGYLQVFK